MKINNTKWLFLIVLPMLAISGKVSGDIGRAIQYTYTFTVNFQQTNGQAATCKKNNPLNHDQCIANQQVQENAAIKKEVEQAKKSRPGKATKFDRAFSDYNTAFLAALAKWQHTLCNIGFKVGQACRDAATTEMEQAVNKLQAGFMAQMNKILNE